MSIVKCRKKSTIFSERFRSQKMRIKGVTIGESSSSIMFAWKNEAELLTQAELEERRKLENMGCLKIIEKILHFSE